MLSSGTLPESRRGHRQLTDRRFRVAVAILGTQMHFVLLARFVVGGDLIAANEQAQRFGRVGNLHAEVRRFRPIEPHRDFRFADAQ